MSPTSILISRRILQSSDIDAFNGGIPETSLTGRNTTSAAAARRLLDPTAPFDSSTALTVLVILTALFFLAFFSVYIRRSSAVVAAGDDVAAPPNPGPKSGRGLDSLAVSSLPLVAYGGAAKHPMIDGCPICLSEFGEGETVKLIPYCGHVFHPRCIDTWLASHVTCPLCRSAELFRRVEEVCLDVAPPDKRSTAEICDGLRRTRSCSDLADRAALQRTTSL